MKCLTFLLYLNILQVQNLGEGNVEEHLVGGGDKLQRDDGLNLRARGREQVVQEEDGHVGADGVGEALGGEVAPPDAVAVADPRGDELGVAGRGWRGIGGAHAVKV